MLPVSVDNQWMQQRRHRTGRECLAGDWVRCPEMGEPLHDALALERMSGIETNGMLELNNRQEGNDAHIFTDVTREVHFYTCHQL